MVNRVMEEDIIARIDAHETVKRLLEEGKLTDAQRAYVLMSLGGCLKK